MVGWHHWLNGHEFQQGLGVGDGQGGLTCCSPLGCKESNMTEWLNWTKLNRVKFICSFNVSARKNKTALHPLMWKDLQIILDALRDRTVWTGVPASRDACIGIWVGIMQPDGLGSNPSATMGLWANHWTSQCLSFHIYKMGDTLLPAA